MGVYGLSKKERKKLMGVDFVVELMQACSVDAVM